MGEPSRRAFPAAALAALTGAAPAADLPAVVAALRPSVVAIGTLERTRHPPVVLRGTGFAIGDGTRVVTNAHVVSGELNADRFETLVVVSGRGREAASRPARLLASDPRHDLAVLDIGAPALPPVRLGDDALIPEGTAVAFTGFPIGAVLGVYPATHAGIVAAHTPIITPADSPRTLSAADLGFLREPYEVYQLDAIAYPGNSGSPVYTSGDGTVVGVVNTVFVKGKREDVLKDPSAITYAVPVRYVRALLAGDMDQARPGAPPESQEP